MKIFVRFFPILFIVYLNFSCKTESSKGKLILSKNECYEAKLKQLKKTTLYNNIIAAFNDTFPSLKTRKEYFGIPEIVTNQVDEAVFFKTDSSECMLVVLKKSKYSDLGFGNARMIRGIKNQLNKWSFEVSMDFFFEKDYFEIFKENSFENISKLARYSVLTDGNYKEKGCEIDDYYWFTELKK